jgi:hypothetical protein
MQRMGNLVIEGQGPVVSQVRGGLDETPSWKSAA